MKPILFITESKYPTIIRDVFEPFEIYKDDVEIIQLPVLKTATDIKQYISEELQEFSGKYIVTDSANFFKQLAKKQSTTGVIGYLFQSLNDSMTCYIPNKKLLFHKPEQATDQVKQSIQAIVNHVKGIYKDPGSNIIHNARYLINTDEIKELLNTLCDAQLDLACDIECYSLKHYEAGIASIAFAWDEHCGISIKVDHAKNEPNTEVREILKNFFINFQNKLVFHNASFDITVLVYQLYMQGFRDIKGMYEGIQHLTKNFDDTQLIAYLATNSTSRNPIGLKALAQEFAGNYALDNIEDVSLIEQNKLLEYNLIDTLCTWYVYNKYMPNMIKDNQEHIYNNIFKPAIIDTIQMQLTGLPININRVQEVNAELLSIQQEILNKINNNPIIAEFTIKLNEEWVIKKNETLKKKRVTIDDAKEIFNPNSGAQLIKLLYEMLELPVLDVTDSGLPATGNDTLKKLKNHTTNATILELLNCFSDITDVNKILSAYMPHFMNAPRAEDGWNYLYGSFHLGGTISGRLSGSNPSLQTLPSGSKYGKKVKSCIQAPPGYLFVGLDFNALEARIDALATKDPIKLSVYLKGYDSHSLNCYYYWPDRFPAINPDNPNSVNTIKDIAGVDRSKSKTVTFALQYAGTAYTLEKNSGFSKEEAERIVCNYKKLYTVSEEYKKEKLKLAEQQGYIDVAFGLRVRTPLMAQSIRGHSKTPREVEGEARTVGNALSQSYGMLNSRAVSAFMSKARNSQFKYQIQHCCQIHDASYYIIPDDIDVVMYVNKFLVEEAFWQDDPNIFHPEVTLGGNLSIFYPTWANEIELSNNATEDELRKACN